METGSALPTYTKELEHIADICSRVIGQLEDRMTPEKSAKRIADSCYQPGTVRWTKLYELALREIKYQSDKATRREILSNMAERDADLILKGY